jgi:hypothetical protein
MKYSKVVLGTALLTSIALGSPALASGSDNHDDSDMSMMGSGQADATMWAGQKGQMPMGSSPGDMSNPMMQMMMMQMMQMMQQRHGNSMPMQGNQGGHHGGMGMMGGKQGGMGMMGGSNGGMPKMEMMQEKQAEMKQHMQSMDTKLGNIEALLQELVDLQKNS